jgi:hypothetical protein
LDYPKKKKKNKVNVFLHTQGSFTVAMNLTILSNGFHKLLSNQQQMLSLQLQKTKSVQIKEREYHAILMRAPPPLSIFFFAVTPIPCQIAK